MDNLMKVIRESQYKAERDNYDRRLQDKNRKKKDEKTRRRRLVNTEKFSKEKEEKINQHTKD